MNERIVRIMGYFSLASPALGFFMLFLSISATSGFNIYNQTLSELGSDGFAAVLFNGGLSMTGALMMLFSTGLWEAGKNSTRGIIGSMMYLGLSVIIVALGFVTINIQPWHNYLSVALFVLIPLSMTLYSLHLFNMGLRNQAYTGFVLGGVSSILWLTGGPVNGLKELASLFCLAIWQVPLGYWMIRIRP